MKTQKLYQMKGKEVKRHSLLWLLPLPALLLLTMAGCDKGDGPENEIMPVPEAKFDYNTYKIIVGGSVKFTDQSTNNPTFWFWDFKDGQTSSEQHPSHTYTIIGNYKVSLVAGNEYGTDTFISPVRIKVLDSTITDIQENEYKIVIIGKQVWMAENLNTETETGSLVYANNTANAAIYGRLYNWETACQVCPEDWHLPSDEEWKKLERYLGMSEDQLDEYLDWNRGEGDGVRYKLKETGSLYWYDNDSATNESGFSALPGGRFNESYIGLHNTAYFWTSTAPSPYTGWSRWLLAGQNCITRADADNTYYYSVRCIRD